MEAQGFDPKQFETLRTKERQQFLFSIGRTRQKNRRPVTYIDGITRTSMHQRGKACDIISKSRWWDWPAFYKALKREAKKEDMHTLNFEQNHIEWRG